MKKVIIVRHGETDWNNVNRVMGWQNRHLNSTGKQQAVQLAFYLKQEYDVETIFSSDLLRARETANIIHALGYPGISKPVLSKELREQKQGKLEGLESRKIPPEYDISSISLAEALTKAPPGGENIKEFNERTINFFLIFFCLPHLGLFYL